MIPALFTSTVGGPSSAAIRSTAAFTWSVLLTSAPTASAFPPAFSISFTVPAQSASFRSRTATAIPSAASLMAIRGTDAASRARHDRDSLYHWFLLFILTGAVVLGPGQAAEARGVSL